MSTAPDLSEFSNEEIIESLNEVRLPFDVAVFSSENYFNMASIIRTCHVHLCTKIWQVDFDKYYEKATMCTDKWENIESITLDNFISETKNRNIVAFERRSELDTKDLRTFSYPNRPILFFGSEKFGVPEDIIKLAHSVVSIPVFGITNDLNIGVAAGIAMYDFVNKTTRSNI